MSKECLDNLAMALPMVGQACLHRQRVQAFANKLFPSGHHTLSFFRKMAEFSSDEDYRNYVRTNIKPGVIVQYIGHDIDIPYGALGDVIDPPFGRERVRWQNGFFTVFPHRNVDDFWWLRRAGEERSFAISSLEWRSRQERWKPVRLMVLVELDRTDSSTGLYVSIKIGCFPSPQSSEHGQT